MTSAPATARIWRPNALDLALGAALLLVGAYAVARAQAVPDYRWDWSVVTTFLVKIDPQTGHYAPNLLLQGLFATLRLAFWGLLLAAPIGVLLGAARLSPRLLPRLLAGAFVMSVRNVPPLVFVFVMVFFIGGQILPALGIAGAVDNASATTQSVLSILFGPPRLIENFAAGVFCLALFSSAYVAEIVRAGLQSVPRSQIEAGVAMGLRRFYVFRFIVLPQALRKVLPPLSSQFIQLIKESSLVSLVSVQELTFMAMDIQTLTQKVFETLLFTGAVYFILCFSLSRLFAALERRSASRWR